MRNCCSAGEGRVHRHQYQIESEGRWFSANQIVQNPSTLIVEKRWSKKKKAKKLIFENARTKTRTENSSKKKFLLHAGGSCTREQGNPCPFSGNKVSNNHLFHKYDVTEKSKPQNFDFREKSGTKTKTQNRSNKGFPHVRAAPAPRNREFHVGWLKLKWFIM